MNKQEIVICDKCTVNLKKAYELRGDANNADVHYFEYERKAYDSEQPNMVKETTLDTEVTAKIGKDTTGQADDQMTQQDFNSSDVSLWLPR